MIIPDSYNYIGVFLTYDCELSCPYCINRYNNLKPTPPTTIFWWAEHLPKIKTTKELPLTLQGGEPTGIAGFSWLVKELHKQDVYMDLLTNGDFNPYYFCKKISPKIFKRGAKYASIRFSYHPRETTIEHLADSVNWMKKQGYDVGIWGLDHPAFKSLNAHAVEYCAKLKIDFRIKEFLGIWKNKRYGTYKYPDGVSQRSHKNFVFCKPSELLINPQGNIFVCHRNLYMGENSQGSISNPNIKLLDKYKICYNFGFCNLCDIKLKFNRYQKGGHCSVDIKMGDWTD